MSSVFQSKSLAGNSWPLSAFSDRHTQTAVTGRRLCVSHRGESSNCALSFSPILSCGDLKEASHWEKLSVVSSSLINSHIQLVQLHRSFSTTSLLLLCSAPVQSRFRGSLNWTSHKSFPGFIVRKQKGLHPVSSFFLPLCLITLTNLSCFVEKWELSS